MARGRKVRQVQYWPRRASQLCIPRDLKEWVWLQPGGEVEGVPGLRAQGLAWGLGKCPWGGC